MGREVSRWVGRQESMRKVRRSSTIGGANGQESKSEERRERRKEVGLPTLESTLQELM